MKIRSYIFLLACLVAMQSCRKESNGTLTAGTVRISQDTIRFDTLFTSVGSVTQYFKLYNDGTHTLHLKKIFLSGTTDSRYHINVDGVEGPIVYNAEIGSKDSLYIFVTVKIDPNTEHLPFLLEDSVAIESDDNTQWVQLQAWGQNANFIRSQQITGNKIWTNSKPYVVIGGLQIAAGATLTITEGTQVFLHADAPILVDGTLRAIGKKYDSTHIVFRSDRLDEGYRDYPGSWPGIFFREGSVDNLIEYAEIRNAYQGLVMQGPTVNALPKVQLNACVIDNCYDAGIVGVHSDLLSTNCLISNCGKNVRLLQGGNYSFTHCTNVAISNPYILHKDPVLAITDYYKIGDHVTYGALKAVFVNSIFWGENSALEDEVVSDKAGSGIFDVQFNNCLWKIKKVAADVVSTNMIENSDPLFIGVDTERSIYDFNLHENSPAIGAGTATSVTTDLKGNSRDAVHPDLGAYEF